MVHLLRAILALIGKPWATLAVVSGPLPYGVHNMCSADLDRISCVLTVLNKLFIGKVLFLVLHKNCLVDGGYKDLYPSICASLPFQTPEHFRLVCGKCSVLSVKG